MRPCSHRGGQEPAWQVGLPVEQDQRLRELGRIASLLAVGTGPELLLLRPALAVVRKRGLGILRRFLSEKFRAEEARIYNHRLDAERFDLNLQRLHPAIEAKL